MANEPRQILHVRENSKEAMDQLFSVLKENRDVQQKSYRDRGLPPSFFNMPNRPHPNHSRENSQDASQYHRIQLTPNHSRSHSSPAQIISSTSLSVPSPNHVRQQSVDILDDPNWSQDPRHLHNFQFRYNSNIAFTIINRCYFMCFRFFFFFFVVKVTHI